MAGRGYMDSVLSNVPQWRALLEAPVACAVFDGIELVFANEAMLDLVRYPVERLLGRAWVALLFPETSEQDLVQREIVEQMRVNDVVRFRRTLACGDGTLRTVDLTTCGTVLPDGRHALLTVAVDMSGLRMPVGGGERTLSDLVEDSPDVMLRVDADTGRVLYVSRAIERLTGYAPDQFYADDSLLSRILLPEYRSLWESCFSRLQQTAPRTFDVAMQTQSGERVILELSLYPVRDAGGRVTVLEGVARDTTSAKQLAELRARNQERASLDRLKSQLLANVSHELRTPLVSIKGYNDLLLRGTLGPINARQRRGLEIAAANTERLIELIETLLDFASREEGRLDLHAARFDLRDAVRGALDAVTERMKSRNLALRCELGDEPLLVDGDRGRLEQVFRSLLTNAEKFTEVPGGEIQVTGHGGGDYVEVAIADRGIGIPVDEHAHIFDRFYQVDASTTRRFGGTGLGLALAKELVTLHQGEILVDSVEGRGSVFTVRLPRAEARDRRTTPAPALVLVCAPATMMPELQTLLGEAALQPLDLLFATNEVELLRRARRHRPDLVLLALPSPDAMLEELKRDPETAKLPVIAVADARRPVGRADLVVGPGDDERLRAGILRLLGRNPPAPAHRARVVVVEDELEILDFTRFVLEREGYEVISVTTGEAALSTVTPEVDLVILDIALEDADGIEVCRQLKAREATAHVPVLMVTAMSGEAVRQGSLGAGADGYLMKPFGLDEFLRQVRLHLRAPTTNARSARESA